MSDDKISMQPSSSIYTYFKNLSYEPWTAIAEFVDNSTQSYFDNKDLLKKLPNFNKLIIEISTDTSGNLIIKDNAYGMEMEDFKRAVRIDKPTKRNDSRNEFGMGLKTAACWFGNEWKVTSKRLGSVNVYSTTVDVYSIAESDDASVSLEKSIGKEDEHYTIIEIKNLNQKINRKTTITKIKKLLASTYRQDLRNGDVEIYFNDQLLTFEEVELFSEIDENGKVKVWKQDIDFTIEHENKILTVKGYVGIRKKGDTNESGITLLRRGRVIIGGLDNNYKPKELLGLGNSLAYQRIIGELHLDNWKVTQAKDEFDWHNDGLEEIFIDKLGALISDLKKKALNIRTRSIIHTETSYAEVINRLENLNVFDKGESEISYSEQVYRETCYENRPELDVDLNKKDTSAIFVGPVETYITTKRAGRIYKLTINMEETDKKWLIITNPTPTDDTYKIFFNIRKDFFKPVNDRPELFNFLMQFILLFAIAEIEAKNSSDDSDKINPSEIRTRLNELLDANLNMKGKGDNDSE